MTTTEATDHTHVLERFRLTDKVAVITGAGQGIGAAIAQSFAEAGADVVLVARTASDLEDVAALVRAAGRRALVFPADLNDLSVLPTLLDRVAAEFGGLDIVVNNAGGSASYPFLETRVEHLEGSFHFNISAPFELSRLAVPMLLERGGGSIINISSVAGSKTTRAGLVHGTMKAAMSHMTKMMAQDLSPRIRVNAVLPGAIETAALARLLSRMDPSVRATMIERTPMRRNGVPDDIAPMVVYLASPAAAWITGKLYDIDGNASADLIPKAVADL